MDVPTGVAQEEGHIGFLIHLLSAVHALIFLARGFSHSFHLPGSNSRPNVSKGYEVPPSYRATGRAGKIRCFPGVPAWRLM